MTLEERKLLAAAFMEQQYHACLYELNLKPSELMRITIDILKKQGSVFNDNFIVLNKKPDETAVRCCPFMR